MRQVNVVYCGWGEQWPLGRLADDGRTLLFEYAPEALTEGLELSPLHLKLRPQAYGDFPAYQHRLSGLLAEMAWRLGRDRHWRLAPAFDLTFSAGPMGQHHMDVCGEGAAIERGHLLHLAQEGGIGIQTAKHSIDRMLPHAASLAGRLAGFPVRRATAQALCATVQACYRRLRG